VSSAAVLGLVAAACGSSGGGSTSGSSTTSGGAATTPGEAPGTVVAGSTLPASSTSTPAETPTPGGKLVMGIEADTSSPWMPAEMLCAISCHQVVKTVYDPMLIPTADGKWAPYLLKSLTPNATYTQWTMTARPGITFHDGTPFNGAALLDNLNRFKLGTLTGAYLADVSGVALSPTDPMSVVLTMKRKWVTFPETLLVGQQDYIASPKWMKAADANPTLKSKPVGTGPFIFESYSPNGSFKAKRNPNYWNKPYPYLDEIEFRPITDGVQRANALKSGALDLEMNDVGEVVAEFRDAKGFKQEEISNNAEVSYRLLHVTQTLKNGQPSPLTDQRVRCALANAYDEPTIIKTIDHNVFPQANGPFAPGTVGYLKDTGYPQKQDMDKAKALIAAYKKDHPGRLTLALATTTDETNIEIAQFEKQWFEEAGVDQVTINSIDQASYILTALLGNFQVFQWRNHTGFDLDNQYIWWDSISAKPVGQLALNFGRIKDPVIDQALDANRGETDPAKKQQYAETINKRFGEQCYDLWTTWNIWGIAHKDAVHGVENFKLPDGQMSQFGQGIAGTFYPQTLWVQH
jgi:ABC-type transport system substrate-binding protein